jgi:hypothetical protein
LDLLPPESSPTRAFEVMVVGRIGKAVLDQVLASFMIPPCPSVSPGLLS